MKGFTRIAFFFASALYIIAALAFLFHGLKQNRQVDTQLITYGFQFLDSVRHGTVLDYLLTVRKYPLLPCLLFAMMDVLVLPMLFLDGSIHATADLPLYLALHPLEIVLASRLLVFAAAAGTFVLLHRASKKLFPAISPAYALILLGSSMLFFLFTSAVRPHVLVTFMTLLTFVLSLRSYRMGFLAALLAFCTLQNGFFAFIFPVWAFLSKRGTLDLSRLRDSRLWLWIGLYVLLTSVLGYPFVWSGLLGRALHLGMGLGNADFDTHPFGLGGLISLATLMVGGEFILLVFFLAAIVSMMRGKKFPQPCYGVLWYLLLFSIFFGINSGTVDRFYMPMLPLMALLGAPILARVRFVHLPLCLFFIVLYFHFAVLGLRPDTYDLARTFLVTHTKGPIVTSIPWYFLDVPPSRASIQTPRMERERIIKGLDHNLPDARAYLPLEQRARADVLVVQPDEKNTIKPGPSWNLCQTIAPATRPTTASMFLWSEVSWPLYWIWQTRSLGPTIMVYCRGS